MGLDQLPLILLLISLNIHYRHTQDVPKVVLAVQIFRGDTVTLTCDTQKEGWTYRWRCGDKPSDSQKKELRVTVQDTQTCRCLGCRGSNCSQWSDGVTLAVSDRPKPRLTVQPDASQIIRGETVTLKCDIQGEGWRYTWSCGDEQQASEENKLNITVWATQTCMCVGCRESCSDWSDGVTLTILAPEAPGLSVVKLLSFLLAASSYLLASVILGVKYCRAHAQSDEINRNAVIEDRVCSPDE